MRQTRRLSLGEAAVSTFIGFAINLAAQRLLFPLFGFTPPLVANLAISGIFTVISIARGYVIRRGFDWWWHREDLTR